MNAPLRLLLVDDEAPARTRLRELLGDIAAELPTEVVGEAGNGREALDLLARCPADLVLVDIRMPVMDGIELAQHLARLPEPPVVIFTTAYDSYAVQAFELSAIDYLLKPIRAQRLGQALHKAAARARPSAPALTELRQAARQSARQHLSSLERGRILLIPVGDILYLRAEQKYVTARTLEREYLLDESLVQLEEEFGERFLRLHRSVLVAREAIAGLEKGADDERDGEGGEHWVARVRGIPETLPVSRRQWSAVKAQVREQTHHER